MICLSSGDAVEPGWDEWKCRGCGRTYPACLGIPDFRPNGGAQPAEVQTLIAAFDSSGFDELVQLRIPNFSTTNERLRAHFANYRFKMTERGKAFYDMARKRAEAAHGPLERERALAIGCGVGASMIPLAKDFGHTVGIDPSLPDLILAKKAASEAGVADRITLIQGYVQSMPLSAESIDFALAEDVLEHVMDLDGAMQDIGRVLRSQGVFIGNSVNRFNMLRPEPHVKLWFVGFLPRRWQAPYARWRRSFIGYDKGTKLPSYWELRGALRTGIGNDSQVTFPDVATFGFSPKLGQVLDVIERIPPVAVPLLWIFPSHLAVGRPAIPQTDANRTRAG
ncbi:MAG: methyltransferase domain-containing protein [Geminicoccaceae bacterium]